MAAAVARSSVLVKVSATTTGSRHAGVGEESREPPAGPAVGGVGRPALDDAGRESRVGAVDGVHPPVGVDDHDPAAGSGDSDQFGDRGVGGVEVLEDALAGDTVEGGVVEVESLDVTGPWNSTWSDARAGPASRFVEHRGARFDPDDGAVGADEAGEGAHDLARAAADVEQPGSEPGPQQLGGGGPQPLDGGQRCLLVQRRDQRGGLGVGVDVAEARRGWPLRRCVTAGSARMVQAADSNSTPSGVWWAAIVAWQGVEGAGAAGVVEALEHPAHQAEHEAVGVVGVVAEPHPGGRTPRARRR